MHLESNVPNMMPGKGHRTYDTFEEADEAAEEEKRAAAAHMYGATDDVGTKKSAMKGPIKQNADDSFARVTWTDLARGKTNNFMSKQGSSNDSARGGLKLTPSIVEFSLAD